MPKLYARRVELRRLLNGLNADVGAPDPRPVSTLPAAWATVLLAGDGTPDVATMRAAGSVGEDGRTIEIPDGIVADPGPDVRTWLLVVLERWNGGDTSITQLAAQARLDGFGGAVIPAPPSLVDGAVDVDGATYVLSRSTQGLQARAWARGIYSRKKRGGGPWQSAPRRAPPSGTRFMTPHVGDATTVRWRAGTADESGSFAPFC